MRRAFTAEHLRECIWRTEVKTLVERVHLAPGCAYSFRRAVIDVSERFGLPHGTVREAEFDLAPCNCVKFE